VKREIVTVFSPAPCPMSTPTVGQPIFARTSSFSATTTRQVLPNVPLSFLWSWKPATLRKYNLQKRPTEVFGLTPSRMTPCV
jgi:hypothetical protein